MSEDPHPPRTIVIGVDGSATSVDALHWALHLASHDHSSVHAVSAWEWPATWGMAYPLPAGFDPEAEARSSLTEILDPLRAKYPDVEIIEDVREGSPKSVLAAVATDADADLLVVGSRGHGEVTGIALGSVSLWLAAHAPCSVLIHHPRP